MLYSSRMADAGSARLDESEAMKPWINPAGMQGQGCDTDCIRLCPLARGRDEGDHAANGRALQGPICKMHSFHNISIESSCTVWASCIEVKCGSLLLQKRPPETRLNVALNGLRAALQLIQSRLTAMQL